MRLFSLAGISVSVNAYFLLMMAVYVYAGLGWQVIILFFIVVTHEFAHLLVARSCNVEVHGVEVFPFGGMARVGAAPDGDPTVEAAIAMAGPLNNFLLYGLGLVLAKVPILDRGLVTFYMDANLMLGLFNMIPALPMDGGRILRAYIAQLWGYPRATSLLMAAGAGVSGALVVWGAVSLIRGAFVPNAFAFAFFLHVARAKECETSGMLSVKSLMKKSAMLNRKRVMPVKHVVARNHLTVREVTFWFVPSYVHLVTVVDGSSRNIGSLWEMEITEAFLSGRGGETLGDLLDSRKGVPHS